MLLQILITTIVIRLLAHAFRHSLCPDSFLFAVFSLSSSRPVQGFRLPCIIRRNERLLTAAVRYFLDSLISDKRELAEGDDARDEAGRCS
jgi:hypothetical protein